MSTSYYFAELLQTIIIIPKVWIAFYSVYKMLSHSLSYLTLHATLWIMLFIITTPVYKIKKWGSRMLKDLAKVSQLKKWKNLNINHQESFRTDSSPDSSD